MTYDEFLAALCIWREARGTSLATKTAIWAVIQNRTTDQQHRWPKTVSGVIAQKWQFSSMTGIGDPNLLLYPVESNPPSMDWTAFLDCQSVVESPLNADPTSGATGYESLPESAAKPHWADPAKITLTLANTRFYKL